MLQIHNLYKTNVVQGKYEGLFNFETSSTAHVHMLEDAQPVYFKPHWYIYIYIYIYICVCVCVCVCECIYIV